MYANKIRNLINILFAFLLLSGLANIVDSPESASAATTIYVDASATGLGDGSSWFDAYPDLQDALTAAEDEDEIWVAAGTYKPGENRAATFQLKNGVAMYGGFPVGGSDFENRDFSTYPTILSGDIGTPENNSDNCYHVVNGSGTDNSAILDGFSVIAGNASSSDPDDRGGGLYNNIGNPIVRNVTFEGNSAGMGGGVYNTSSNPLIKNVTFSNNIAGGVSLGYSGGGGLYNHYSNPIISNTKFSGNEANCGSTSCGGGGIYNYHSSPIIVNVSFDNNIANGYEWYTGGGGIYTYTTDPINDLWISNSIFWRNSTTCNDYESGGGVIYNRMGKMRIVNSVFNGNTAVNGRDVIYKNAGNLILSNCILWENGDDNHQIYNRDTPTIVTYSVIQGGYDGIGNLDIDPLFRDSTIGDFRLQFISPSIDAGDNTAVFTDTLDLDEDGNTTEPIPFDFDGNDRFFDMPIQPNIGSGTSPLVDMGAYEVFNTAPDLDHSGEPYLNDVFEDDIDSAGTLITDILASGANGDPISDIDPDQEEGIVVIGVDTTNGDWQYSTDSGSTWNDFGAVSNSSAVLLSDSFTNRIRFVPDQNYNGTIDPGLTFRAWDGSDGFGDGTSGVNIFISGGASPYSSNIEIASLTVQAVNDAPNINAILAQIIIEDAIPQLIDLTGIDAGAVNENQTLTLTVLSSDTGLVPDPEINYTSPNSTGSLIYESLPNENGSATLTVEIKDDGGTANGGVDTQIRSFSITVNPVNDPPSFTKGEYIIVPEDSGSQSIENWASYISAGPDDESNQILTFTLTPDHQSLFSSSPSLNPETGDLNFTPADNAFGDVEISVLLQDNGDTAYGGVDSYSDTFSMTITPVNDIPVVSSFSKIGNVNTDLTFSSSDFAGHFIDVDGDSLEKIKVTTLPSFGDLNLDGVTVKIDQEIQVSELENLIFTPNNYWIGSTNLNWTGNDGTVYAQNEALVSIAIYPETIAVYLPIISKILPPPLPTPTPPPTPIPTPTLTPTPPPTSWVNIVTENFEGDFPNVWQLDDYYGSGEYLWAKSGCRVYSGNYSGWAIGGGANGTSLGCGTIYPYDVDSWMTFGPFSLADAAEADLRVKFWLDSEYGYDEFCSMASLNNIDYYGTCYSGYSSGWVEDVLNLKSVPYMGSLMGQSQVWISFYFYSDDLYNDGEGAYIDEIVLRKCSTNCTQTLAHEMNILSLKDYPVIKRKGTSRYPY